MNRRTLELILTFAGPIVILLLWETLSRLEWINPLFWPTPSSLWPTAMDMLENRGLVGDIRISLFRIFGGFIIGTVPGVILGLAMGLFWPVRVFVMPIATAVYAIPKMAILPLAIIAFGVGELSKVMIVAISIFFMIALSTMSGVLAIDNQFHDVARNLGANRWQMFYTVALPGSLAPIFTGMRLSLGFALIVIVGTEFLMANEGIGHVIWQSYQILRIKEMFVGLIITGLMGWGMNLILDVAERTLVPWRNQ